MTLKIKEAEDGTFHDVSDAINYMKETNYERDVCVYDINDEKAYEKTIDIYEHLKSYNKGKDLDNQILPTCPYAFRGILGCLGVSCYSIALGTYKRNHNLIAICTGYNDSVLDAEKTDIRPSMRALASMSIVMSIMKSKENENEK